MATIVLLVLSLALYTVANCRGEREQWEQKHWGQHHFVPGAAVNSMQQQGFVDTDKRLTLVSMLSWFPHNELRPAAEGRAPEVATE